MFAPVLSLMAALAALVCGVGCTRTVVVHGQSKLALTNLGSHTKAAKIQIGGAEGILIDGWDDNATASFSKTVDLVKGMWSNYLTAAGLKFVAGKYYDHQDKIVSADKSVSLEKLRNAKSKADASAALERLKLETSAGEFVRPNPDGSLP